MTLIIDRAAGLATVLLIIGPGWQHASSVFDQTTNLNQLARIANTTGRIDYSQRLVAILNELTEAIRRLV